MNNWPIASAMLWAGAKHDAGPAAWRSDLAQLCHAGFTDLDPTDTWVRLGDLSPAGLTEFAGVVDETGLRIPALSTSRRSPIDPVTGDDNLAYLHRTIDAAAALRIPLVSVGLFEPLTKAQSEALWFWTADGPVNPPEVRPLAVERIRALAQHGAEVGVAISLEMYEDTFLGTADSSVELIHEIDHENVGLNPDIANLIRLHRPVEHWRVMLEKVLPYSNYWHAKNYTRDEDARTGAVSSSPSLLLGGLIDYRWAVRHAFELGYRGAFCLEQYGGDSLGVCSANRTYLRDLLQTEVGDPVS